MSASSENKNLCHDLITDLEETIEQLSDLLRSKNTTDQQLFNCVYDSYDYSRLTLVRLSGVNVDGTY